MDNQKYLDVSLILKNGRKLNAIKTAEEYIKHIDNANSKEISLEKLIRLKKILTNEKLVKFSILKNKI